MSRPPNGSHGLLNIPPRDFTFDHFRLVPSQRLLLRDGNRVDLGSRAFDVLIALVVHAGQVVSNRDLIRLVWQDVVVDESCLRVHISALRKALCCAESDTRYISNIPGRGYSFVASTAFTPLIADIETITPQWSVERLPPRLLRMVGRDDTVITLAEQLKYKRFITISGPGGIGKSTVAVAVAHHLIPHFEGMLLYLDVGSITDPHLLVGSLASVLGVRGHRRDVARELMTFLRDRRLLLILDGCDHVIDATTDLAERLFLEADQVHILATSREPLRAEGEHVYRLCPLACPPQQRELTAAAALTFSAVQLFVERAATNGNAFTLSDSDAPVVAHICRKLDGIALAIELGAGRVDAYGIQGTAELLNSRFSLLWDGRRTAPPRHQTLNAMLDWSYTLLSETEATVLRRLSILNGGFSLETAKELVNIQETMFIDAIARLVAKSLVEAENVGRTMRYRLLDTTRAYALEKLRSHDEVNACEQSLALYLVSLLGRLNVTNGPFPSTNTSTVTCSI
jgi:predicted ATPase/DNA-binding winged helix-turn-helix (wHTH) protein